MRERVLVGVAVGLVVASSCGGRLVGGGGNPDASVTCPMGLTLCGAACIDTSSSASNCGACGNACANNMVCSFGTCTSVCASGLIRCGQDCVNLRTDAANCGA